MKYGDALRFFRLKRGFSLRELGALANVDHSYLHRLETGKKVKVGETWCKTVYKALKLNRKDVAFMRFLNTGFEMPAEVFTAVRSFNTYPLTAVRIAALTVYAVPPVTVDDWIQELEFIQTVILYRSKGGAL